MDDYRKRVAQLYSDERTRWRKILQKGVPKNVKIEIPAHQVLPYTQQQFGKWLWGQIQLQAIPCPYCRAPIDIITMQLDHKTPLRRKGGPEIENKQCICERCNKAKGEFTHEEYIVIVALMDGPGAFFRQRLEGVLIMGGLGNRMKNFPGKGKDKSVTQVTQDSLYFSELSEF
jgi:5-methylcytosine-specific restriction endonuclease McrA